MELPRKLGKGGESSGLAAASTPQGGRAASCPAASPLARESRTELARGQFCLLEHEDVRGAPRVPSLERAPCRDICRSENDGGARVTGFPHPVPEGGGKGLEPERRGQPTGAGRRHPAPFQLPGSRTRSGQNRREKIEGCTSFCRSRYSTFCSSSASRSWDAASQPAAVGEALSAATCRYALAGRGGGQVASNASGRSGRSPSARMPRKPFPSTESRKSPSKSREPQSPARSASQPAGSLKTQSKLLERQSDMSGRVASRTIFRPKEAEVAASHGAPPETGAERMAPKRAQCKGHRVTTRRTSFVLARPYV